MRLNNLLVALVCSLIPAKTGAEDNRWRQYVIPQTGAAADIPATIFTEDAGPPVRDGAFSQWIIGQI
jgi:hypothetical protein